MERELQTKAQEAKEQYEEEVAKARRKRLAPHARARARRRRRCRRSLSLATQTEAEDAEKNKADVGNKQLIIQTTLTQIAGLYAVSQARASKPPSAPLAPAPLSAARCPSG